MNFYLQYGIKSSLEGYPEPRLFIDETLHPDCNLLKTMECDDWLTARAACGPLVIADALDYVALEAEGEGIAINAKMTAAQFVEIGQAA